MTNFFFFDFLISLLFRVTTFSLLCSFLFRQTRLINYTSSSIVMIFIFIYQDFISDQQNKSDNFFIVLIFLFIETRLTNYTSSSIVSNFICVQQEQFFQISFPFSGTKVTNFFFFLLFYHLVRQLEFLYCLVGQDCQKFSSISYV